MQNRLFRKVVEEDSEAIVTLLKASLGETSSLKSIAYWNWKHKQNPFGKSEVMVSEVDGTLSGIRAMMPWVWQAGNHQFKTFRAVDTATHPNFQGKGIFSKLTQTMVSHLQLLDADFIFNTPNNQSLPGYLKMGWQKSGRIKVRILPFIFIRGSRWHGPNQGLGIDQTSVLCSQWNNMQSQHGKLFTPKSPAYLKWRYIDNPVINYHCHADSELFVAAHIKQQKWFTELRISELITDQKHGNFKPGLFSFIKGLAKHNKVDFVTLSEEAGKNFNLPGLTLPIGPLMTIRNLSGQVKIPDLLHWSPALGDLELF